MQIPGNFVHFYNMSYDANPTKQYNNTNTEVCCSNNFTILK